MADSLNRLDLISLITKICCSKIFGHVAALHEINPQPVKDVDLVLSEFYLASVTLVVLNSWDSCYLGTSVNFEYSR